MWEKEAVFLLHSSLPVMQCADECLTGMYYHHLCRSFSCEANMISCAVQHWIEMLNVLLLLYAGRTYYSTHLKWACTLIHTHFVQTHIHIQTHTHLRAHTLTDLIAFMPSSSIMVGTSQGRGPLRDQSCHIPGQTLLQSVFMLGHSHLLIWLYISGWRAIPLQLRSHHPTQ